MAASFFIRRSVVPGMTCAAAGMGYAVLQREKTNQEVSIRCFINTSVTNCDAPAEQQLAPVNAKPTLATVPVPDWKKQLLSPELEVLPWLERVEVTTRTKQKETAGIFPWTKVKEHVTEHVTEVYLLGVVHGSNKSAEDVKRLLETVDPDVTFIELCLERNFMLHLTPDMTKGIPFNFFPVIMGAYDQGLGVKHTLYYTFVAYVQHFIARHGSGVAGEFRTAYDFVKSTPKDRFRLLVLCDRPHSLSIGRLNDLNKPLNVSMGVLVLEELYGNMPPREIGNTQIARGDAQWKKAWTERNSFADFIMRGVFENHDLLASCVSEEEFQFPEGTENRVMFQERDIFMCCTLIQMCQLTKPKRVVVIVGGSHVRGMTHLLNADVIGSEFDPEQVLSQLVASEKYPEGDKRLEMVSHFAVYNNQD